MIIRKLKKIIYSPRVFSRDFLEKLKINNYLNSSDVDNEKIIFAFHVANWKKEFINKVFSDSKIIYIPFKKSISEYKKFLCANKNYKFLAWGMNLPEDAKHFVDKFGVQVIYLEDGFVRSVGLGALHILPYSICLDKKGIYFNAKQSSDLEILLSTKDFSSDLALMEEAKECMDLIRVNKITKYNLAHTCLAEKLYGPKDRARILVIGQVEDDQSIIFGCDKKVDNNYLVRLAALENPGAQIIYKVHPDVIAAKRKELSNPKDVENLAILINVPMSLDDALIGVDKVYTISSLAGFESLLRGVPVVTLGCPFYGGWGLTDTRQENSRRIRRLSLEELFAGAYLLYPKYIDPESGASSTLKKTIQNILNSSKGK